VKPGRHMELQPRWLTASGLQINSVTITDGVKPPNQPLAKINLLNAAGESLATDSCGFY